jgi:hypothetical protein
VSIAWFRDLVIIIFGLLGIIMLILGAICAYLRYRETRMLINKVNSILDSTKNIAGLVEGIVSRVGATAGPLMEIMSVFKIINQIGSLFKKKEG